MDKYELLLHDLNDILKTIDEVNHVSHGRPKPLNEEDAFTTVYITPTADNFILRSQGYEAGNYDNVVYIRLLVHMDCTGDELAWTKTRRKVIDAVLNDSPIWNTVVDRDIVSTVHDDYTLFPRKAMELLFEFKIREDCVI